MHRTPQNQRFIGSHPYFNPGTRLGQEGSGHQEPDTFTETFILKPTRSKGVPTTSKQFGEPSTQWGLVQGWAPAKGSRAAAGRSLMEVGSSAGRAQNKAWLGDMQEAACTGPVGLAHAKDMERGEN